VFRAGRNDAGLFEEFQDGVFGVLDQGFQLTGIEPDAPALVAEVHFDIVQVQDEQGDVTFWTDG
jgi:hypothetical protein